MKKINCFTNIFGIISFLICQYCFIRYLDYKLSGKIYLNLNENNYSKIVIFLNSNEKTKPKGKLIKIGHETTFSFPRHEWDLIIKYEDSSEETIHIYHYEHEYDNLERYIRENGIAGGDEAIKNLNVLKVSFIMIVVFVIYKIFYWYCKTLIFINKKTDEIINKQDIE